MKSLINGYLGMAFSMVNDMNERNEEWKERIQKQWAESRNLPRKKKKELRKSLLLNWRIASWNPFEF